jgi:dipeptidyl aminopeptidase/acylaminoacyl peptidase
MLWCDRNGKPIGATGDRSGHPRNSIRISPDGASVAFTRDDKGQHVWIAAARPGADPRRITARGGRTPVWSPDSSEIAFLRGDTIYRQKIDAGVERVVWTHAGILAINDWSGDGRHLLLTVWDTTRARGRLWRLSDLSNPSAPPVDAALNVDDHHGLFAPPADPPRWVIFDGVNVLSMGGTAQDSYLFGTGIRSRHPRLPRSAKELVIADGDYVSVAPVLSWTPVPRFGKLERLFPVSRTLIVAFSQWAPGWDVTPDGQGFLISNPSVDTPAATIRVINWDAALSSSAAR